MLSKSSTGMRVSYRKFGMPSFSLVTESSFPGRAPRLPGPGRCPLGRPLRSRARSSPDTIRSTERRANVAGGGVGANGTGGAPKSNSAHYVKSTATKGIPMSIAISEDHQALAETVSAFLAKHDALGANRQLLEADSEPLPAFWREIAGLGWLGLHLPEDVGGSGFGFPELVVVVEQFGR